MQRTLIIGGSGFVGGYFYLSSRRSRRSMRYFAPTHSELDITRLADVLATFQEIKPHFIVNFAAITNMDKSEKERNNKKGETWQTNYIGVKHLVDTCKKHGIFLIQISTDAIFPGTDAHCGPYGETDKPPRNGKGLNWYGYSKLKAEEKIKTMKRSYAIIRISHPFGNPASPRDLVQKTVHDITAGHQLFADQLFTPTFLEDLTRVIWKIQSQRAAGIFHVGCKNLVARIEFDRYLAVKLNMTNKLKKGSLKSFMAQAGRAPRTRLGGFISTRSQKKLGVVFHTWQRALDKTLRLIKSSAHKSV